MNADEITTKIEDTLYELYDLIRNESSLKYNKYNQHRRIIEKCKQISEFFE